MFELCKLKDLIHAHKLVRISTVYGGLPFDKLPDPKSDEALICAYDQWGIGDGENARLIVCQSKDDIKSLYSSYSSGGALDIKWYLAPKPQFITSPTCPGTRLVSLTAFELLSSQDPTTFSLVVSKLSSCKPG